MTNSEFSAQFDVLWNNVTSNQAPGVNEYEKSVFLTKAQSQLVNEYFNNRTDGFGGGFDGSQKRQYDFSGLVRVEELYNVNTFTERINSTEKLDKRSKVFLFPENYYLAVNEILSDGRWQYSVIPLSYAEYQRVMTKPYNFPIKRGAWRIFTDKKNCNVWETTTTSEGLLYNEENYPNGLPEGVSLTQTTYSFVSSWADKKRNIIVDIKFTNDDTIECDHYETLPVSDKYYLEDEQGNRTGAQYFYDNDDIYFHTDIDGDEVWSRLHCSTEWEDNQTYSVTLRLRNEFAENDMDDETVLKYIQAAFGIILEASKTNGNWNKVSWDTIKAAKHTDGFVQADFPSKYNFAVEGLMFTTTVKPIPMAEIIGKFYGEVKYQLRYIRTLTPIILEDLTNYGDDITIDGVTAATECALPVETHQEILERAVTLAKIAWQGGTMTQAVAQRDNS